MTNCIYFFIIGSFLGWMLEVMFKIFTKNFKRLPGILNSPFCILYGFGTLICYIISATTQNLLLQFVLCFIFLTLIEYITYDLLNKIYNIKLWDYSHLRINAGGKISLKYSLIWGTIGIIFIHIIMPICNVWLVFNNNIALKIVLLVLITYIAWDFLESSKKLLKISSN